MARDTFEFFILWVTWKHLYFICSKYCPTLFASLRCHVITENKIKHKLNELSNYIRPLLHISMFHRVCLLKCFSLLHSNKVKLKLDRVFAPLIFFAVSSSCRCLSAHQAAVAKLRNTRTWFSGNHRINQTFSVKSSGELQREKLRCFSA